jgi:hypothetical protein
VLLPLCWVPDAPIAGAWTAGLSLGSGNRKWGRATVEPGASVDSQVARCGCPVSGFTPRDAATMIMSYLRIGAHPLDSLDCSTVARGGALAALTATARRGAAAVGCDRTYRSCRNRQQNMKAVQFS